METHDHHKDAAHHFELAAEHPKKAHEHHLEGNHEKSAHHAHLAHGHQKIEPDTKPDVQPIILF